MAPAAAGLVDLQARRLIRLERLNPATWPALQARLRQGDIHILHFVGHGGFDPAASTGGLIFEDAAGRADEVSAETLAMLLHDHAALRLIFLNACEGARSGQFERRRSGPSCEARGDRVRSPIPSSPRRSTSLPARS